MLSHTDERPVLKCKFCDKVYACVRAPINFLFYHVVGWKFLIIYIFLNIQSYLSKLGLLNHERLHTGEEPYFCQYCHKVLQTFLIHFMARTSNFLIESLFLNQSFRILSVWKEHEKKHTGERLKCGVCSKVFFVNSGGDYVF